MSFDSYSNISQDPFLSMYSLGPQNGIATGNSTVDLMLNMMLGQYLAPRPPRGTSQSVYDAFIRKNRSTDFISVGRSAFASNMIAQRLGGINPNSPALGMLTGFMALPDSPAMQMLSPLLGGNPVKAQMGMYANLTGHTMGAFGQIGNVSAAQTDELMKMFNNKMNLVHTYSATEAADDKAEIRARARKLIKDKGGKNAPDVQAAFEEALATNDITKYTSQFGDGSHEKLSNILERLKKTSEDLEKDTDLKPADRQKKQKEEQERAEKAGQKFIDQITDPSVRLKMTDAFSSAVKDGAKKADQFKDQYGQPADILRLLNAGLAIDSKIGNKVQGGINYTNTRGFNIEDVTGAFTNAADMRLMGRRSLGSNFEGFTSNGVATLDAARSIFGNDKSGKQLTSALSDLLGTDFVDLADPTSAKKLEQLLYMVKGAANTAGIGIDAMVGIIAEFKQLASNTNGTQLMGGAGIAAAAARSMDRTTAQVASMSSEALRLAGGPSEIIRRNMAGVISGRAQPVAQGVGALYEYFSLRGDTRATEEIKRSIQSGNWARQGGYGGFINRLSAITGEGAVSLSSRAANNPMASQIGANKLAAENIEVSDVAANATLQEFALGVQSQYGNRKNVGMALYNLALNNDKGLHVGKFLRSHGIDINSLTSDERRSLQVISRRRQSGNRIEFHELTSLLKLNGAVFEPLTSFIEQNGYDVAARRQSDPAYREISAAASEASKYYAQTSEQVAEQYGHLNANLGTQVLNNLFSGKLHEQGISGLISGIKDEGTRSAVQQHLATAGNLSRTDAMTEPNLVRELRDSKKGKAFADLNELTEYDGLTAEQIRGLSEKNLQLMIDTESQTRLPGTERKNKNVLKQLKRLQSGDVKANIAGLQSSLDFIDPSKKTTGNVDVRRGLQESEVKAARKFQDDAQRAIIGQTAKVEYGKMINAKFAGLSDAEKSGFDSSKQRNDELFEKYGVFSKDTGFDAARFNELMSDDKSAFASQFNQNKFKGNRGSEAYYRGIENITGRFKQRTDDVGAASKAEEQAMSAQVKLGNAMEQLTKMLGENFGSNIISTISSLSSNVKTAVGIN